MLKQNGKKWPFLGVKLKLPFLFNSHSKLSENVAIWCNAGKDEKWKSLLPSCDMQQLLFGGMDILDPSAFHGTCSRSRRPLVRCSLQE